jgi:hypothetical protein
MIYWCIPNVTPRGCHHQGLVFTSELAQTMSVLWMYDVWVTICPVWPAVQGCKQECIVGSVLAMFSNQWGRCRCTTSLISNHRKNWTHYTLLVTSPDNWPHWTNCNSYIVHPQHRYCLSSFWGKYDLVMMAIISWNMLGQHLECIKKSHYYLDAFVGYFTIPTSVYTRVAGTAPWAGRPRGKVLIPGRSRGRTSPLKSSQSLWGPSEAFSSEVMRLRGEVTPPSSIRVTHPSRSPSLCYVCSNSGTNLPLLLPSHFNKQISKNMSMRVIGYKRRNVLDLPTEKSGNEEIVLCTASPVLGLFTLVENPRSQTLHLNGRSLVWLR